MVERGGVTFSYNAVKLQKTTWKRRESRWARKEERKKRDTEAVSTLEYERGKGT